MVGFVKWSGRVNDQTLKKKSSAVVFDMVYKSILSNKELYNKE